MHICGDREACTSAPVLKEQAATLVPYIARFISFCAPEQTRLAPEKCMYICLHEFHLMGTNVVKSCVVYILMLFIVGVLVIAVCKRFKDQVMLLGTPNAWGGSVAGSCTETLEFFRTLDYFACRVFSSLFIGKVLQNWSVNFGGRYL